MGFIQPCFIRNNKSNFFKILEKLKILGYREGVSPHSTHRNDDKYSRDIHLFEDKYHFRTDILYGITNCIDCGDNEELFLALAALRDDTRDFQWFIWEDENDYGEGDDGWKQYIPGEYWEDWWWFEVRKATVEEIIEHFKK